MLVKLRGGKLNVRWWLYRDVRESFQKDLNSKGIEECTSDVW